MSHCTELYEAKKRLSTLGFVAPEAQGGRLRYIEECLDAAIARWEAEQAIQERCAGKLAMSYAFGEIEPRAEFDALIELYGLTEKARRR